MKNILTGTMGLLMFAADKASAAGDSTPAAPEFTVPPVVDTAAIELKKLVIDAGTQPRVAIDEEVVQEYTEVIKNCIKTEQPIPFPAVTVFRDKTGRCVLADGFHRYAAHKAAHAKEIECEIREGDERAALLFSCSANTTHGVRRTNKDKTRAVKILLADEQWAQWANTVIARACGVSEFLVRDLRPAAKSPTTRKATIRGKTTSVKTGAIGKGKGGGAKGKKAAAKKAGKSGKGAGKKAPGDGADENKGPLADVQREIGKIAGILGDTEGKKFKEGLESNSLELSKRDIRDFAGLSDGTIKNIWPLVSGGSRMRPYKAYEFVKGGIPQKMQETLHLLALGSGGAYIEQFDGFNVEVQLGKRPAAPSKK